ncbi:MAG: hypothetical protein KC994_19050, partial [Candidatus Omnitrophica bacterium]|nr:hypothetical protein [Candidatus Omnitrophota bacterium]
MSSFSRCTLTLLFVGVVQALFHVDAVAHPMDSYAIDQYMDFRIEGNQVHLIHRIEFAEIPTASELPKVDTNQDMSLSNSETLPYVQKTVDQLKKELVLTVDGEPLQWEYLQGEAFLDSIPSTRLKVVSEYQTSFSGDLGDGRLFRFDLQHLPGARGDRQTRIATRGMTALKDVASSENLQPPGMAPPAILDTAALVYGHKVQWTVVPSETMAPDEVPDFSIRAATGPAQPANPFLSLNQRDFPDETMGEPPANSGGVGPATQEASGSLRDAGAPNFAEGAESKPTKETWADRQFRKMFLDSKAGKAGWLAFLGFSLLSLLYGAAHALEPGHGKTVVAAYLVGSHGTVFHAVMLALIVTFTHTFSVYILGIIALTNLEKVQGTYLPILEVGSWFLIFCMGLWLFLKYYKYYVQGKLADPTFHTHGFGEGHTHLPDGSHPHDHDHSHEPHHHDHDHHHHHDHPHDHDHNHSHSHDHDHDHKHD